MSSKKTFFVRVDKKGEIDTKKSAKEFTDFLGKDTTLVQRSIKEESTKVEVAETVFGMFDELEAEFKSHKTPVVEEEQEQEPIIFETQKEVDGFNELSEVLYSEDVAGKVLEQLTGEKLDLDQEPFDIKVDTPQAVLQEESNLEEAESVTIQLDENDPMSKYVDRIRVSNQGVEIDLNEQDLQNTPASMADLQKATQGMMKNIQMSLTSLGGGGLGENDVVGLIKEYAPPVELSDSDLQEIIDSLDSSMFNGIDSSDVIGIITDTVDSAYVNTLVEASDIDSSHVVGIVQPMIDSAIAAEHQFNVDDHAEIRIELDSAIQAEHAFNVAENNKLKSDFDSAIAAEHAFNITAHGELDSSITNGLASLDSAITEEHNFNLVDHALIRSELDSAIQAEHAFNVAEHAALDSEISAVQGHLSAIDLYTSADFDSDLARKNTDDVAEGNNLYYTDARVATVVDSMRDDTWFSGQLATNSIAGLQDVHTDSLQSDQVLVWNGSVWHNEDYPQPPPIFTYHGPIDCTTDSAPAGALNGDTYLNTGTGAVLVGGGWTGLTTVTANDYIIYDADHTEWGAFSLGGGGGVSAVRAGFGINVVGTSSMPTVEVDSAELHTFLADKDENDSAHAQFRSDLTQLRDDHDSDTLALNTDLAKKVTKTGDTMTGGLVFDRGVGQPLKINPADGTTAVIDLFQGGNSTLTYTDLRLSGATFRNVFRVMGGPSPHEEVMKIPSDASGVTINKLFVDGQTELDGKLTVDANQDITGDLDITGTLDVNGQSTFFKNVTVKDGYNLRVVDAGEVSSNTYNSVGNSNVSLKRNNETNLQLLSKTTRAQKVIDYPNGVQASIYSDSAVADTFLTHKGYVTDVLTDLRTSVDSDFNDGLSTKVSKTGDTMTGTLTVPELHVKSQDPAVNHDTLIFFEGRQTSSSQIVSQVKFVNLYNNTEGSLRYYGTSGSNAYFRLSNELKMASKPISSVENLSFTGSSSSIKVGSNLRINFKNSSSGGDGQGYVEIPRGSTNYRRTFSIRGNDATGSQQDMLYSSTAPSTDGGDAINYVGKMIYDQNLINKGYVDDNFVDKTGDTMTGNLKTPRVELDALKFNGSSIQKAIIENTTVRMEFDGKVIVKRGGTSNASGFTLQGKNAFGNAGELLAVRHNSSGYDEVNYTGLQTKSTNLINRGYLDAAIRALMKHDYDQISGNVFNKTRLSDMVNSSHIRCLIDRSAASGDTIAATYDDVEIIQMYIPETAPDGDHKSEEFLSRCEGGEIYLTSGVANRIWYSVYRLIKDVEPNIWNFYVEKQDHASIGGTGAIPTIAQSSIRSDIFWNGYPTY